MVLDSSAVFAILRREPEAERIAAAIEADGRRVISTGTQLECVIVALREGGEGMVRELDLLLHAMRCDTVAFTEEQLDAAREAFGRYGKGLHPAGLNFGDCFAYALAKTSGEPLLFKGLDFGRTDVAAVRW